MKLVLRILNIVIMAISAVAIVFLFTAQTLSFNSKIVLDVETFSNFVPKTEFTDDIKIVDSLGTDSIEVGIKFGLSPMEAKDVMNGNKEIINNNFINNNVDEIVSILHEPVDLITEYSIRSILKSTIKNEITNYVDNARKQYGSESTAEDIMNEVGMDDAYFEGFTLALYDSMNQDTSTIDSVGDTLYEQVDDALAKSEESGVVDTSVFSEDSKAEIKNNLLAVLTDLNLVEDGGKLKKISEISYLYLSSFLKEQLQAKVSDPSSLEQASDETLPNYSDRMLKTYVLVMMPDAFYTVVGYVSMGLFIGLFVFAALWGFLLIWTFIKTFTPRPWTLFGFWFWPIGSLQLILGLGLTIFGKFIFPMFDFSSLGLPIKTIILAPRTYALVPSLLFVIAIAIAIVYGVIKRRAKREK